jgi:ribose transport system ATP-binding protein
VIRPAATGSGADDVTTPMLHSRGMSDAPSVDAPPLLEMRGMTKRFPGVDALRDVDLRLEAGECLALCGENGAGKSTLVKLLGGVHRADAGEIRIDGRPTGVPSPHHARRLGIALIHQELSLVPRLSARENIFLGRERTRFGFPDHRREARDATRLFERLGVDVDPESSCGDLTVAQQQAVEIARALAVEARVIVMDEPSATLTGPETQRLFAIIRELTASGMGVVYISHRIEEIFAIADRVQVLRDGRHVATEATGDVTRARLIEQMVGRPLEAEFPSRAVSRGPERLRVEGLRRGDAVRDVSFRVHAGEVLGFAGLVGAGRTETMRLIFGADRADTGKVYVDGRPCRISGPREAIRLGIGLLTEDRKAQGLVLGHTAAENFALPNLDRLARGPFVDRARERERFAHYAEALRIRSDAADAAVGTLSGGNQQKVVLAKWLERDSRVVIFDEPTRGIDVAVKLEIYELINRLAAEGKAVVLVSSELPELLGLCDRIVVMHGGEVKGEIDEPAEATQEGILAMAVSGAA